MSRKLISLVQPNFQQGPKEYNAHYLPYSVGVLWAYVNQFDSIKANYQLEDLIQIIFLHIMKVMMKK